MAKRSHQSATATERISIHYVVPHYESETEREAALVRGQEVLKQLARLLGRMAAAEDLKVRSDSCAVPTPANALRIKFASREFNHKGHTVMSGAKAIRTRPKP
jgi:hypothetical protein